MEANSVTVSTRNGQVTIATQGDVSAAGQPIVRCALTLGLLTYPVQMSLTDARKLARHLLDAANSGQLQADGMAFATQGA